MPFADLNDDFEFTPLLLGGNPLKRAEISPAVYAALPMPAIPCGFFTLTLTDGSQKRFRIRLERGSFITGKRTLARHNKVEVTDDSRQEHEWETIAIIGSAGFEMFKRWRGTWEERWAQALFLLLHPDTEPPPGYSVESDIRCRMCLRKLPGDEVSQRTQLSPVCRKKVGVE